MALIPAAEWNAERALARGDRPLSGRGVRLIWTSEGVWVALDASDQFHHPWELSLRWRENTKLRIGGEWAATVRPGFVNGHDVTMKVERDNASVHVPLTDEEAPELVLGGFRNPAASLGVTVTSAGDVVSLAAEGYPKFFDQLGVVPAAKDRPGFGIGFSEDDDPNRTRQIRAADIVLVTPRFGSRQQVDLRMPFTDAQTIEISTVYLNGRARSAASANYLVSRSKWEVAPAPTALDRLMGTAVETEQDELLMATVYFVSPPDAGDDAEVDHTWTPYPAYKVFWNLAYGSKNDPGRPVPQPITIHTGLLFGIADDIFNYLLSPVNDAFTAIYAFLNAADFSGLYWTLGQLGSEGQTAGTTGASAPDGLGLDPLKRRLAREAKAAVLNAAPPLNPPFPFRRLKFDPWFFGIESDPPAKKTG